MSKTECKFQLRCYIIPVLNLTCVEELHYQKPLQKPEHNNRNRKFPLKNTAIT